MRAIDRTLQDDAARSKIAGPLRSYGFLAHVRRRHFEHSRPALGTRTQGLLPAEIGRLRIAGIARTVAEIELRLVGLVELELRRERAPQLAPESFQGSHLALRKQRLGLGYFQLTAGDDLPHAEVAGLALELLVLFVDFATALGTSCAQGREIALDRIAFMVLRLRDNVLRHRDDLTHEVLALALSVLHLRELEFPFGGELRRKKLGNT